MRKERTRSACGLLLAAAALTRPAPAQDGTELGLRLEPGFIWRQRVAVEAEIERPDGTAGSWKQEYVLRWKCLEERDGAWLVEGTFVDWTLVLRTGLRTFEWREQSYTQEGLSTPSGGDGLAEALLRAWAEGLRRAELRLLLDPRGRLLEFQGLESLEESLTSFLGDPDRSLPLDLAHHFGEAGLERAATALRFAVAVPRPAGPVEPGATWEGESWLQGVFPGPCRLQRRFIFQGEERLRRHRLARLQIQARGAWLGDDGRPHPLRAVSAAAAGEPVPEPAEPTGHAAIELASGLLFHLDLALAWEEADGSRARCRLASDLVD